VILALLLLLLAGCASTPPPAPYPIDGTRAEKCRYVCDQTYEERVEKNWAFDDPNWDFICLCCFGNTGICDDEELIPGVGS
jgi:hypothetical protein